MVIMTICFFFSAYGPNASGHGVSDASGGGNRSATVGSSSNTTVRLSSRNEPADLPSGAHGQDVRFVSAAAVFRAEPSKCAESGSASSVHDGSRPAAASAAVSSSSTPRTPPIPDHVPLNPDTAPHDAGSWNALSATASTSAGPHSSVATPTPPSTTAWTGPLALIEFLANYLFFFK